MELEERVQELEAGGMIMLALIDALAVTHPNLERARARALRNAALVEAGMPYTDFPDELRQAFTDRLRRTALSWDPSGS